DGDRSDGARRGPAEGDPRRLVARRAVVLPLGGALVAGAGAGGVEHGLSRATGAVMRRIAWGGGFVLLLALGLAFGLWLGSKRTPSVVTGPSEEEWLARLRSDDPDEGTRAWQQLAEQGEAGLPILFAARKDADVRVYRRAALGLVKVGGPAVPGL